MHEPAVYSYLNGVHSPGYEFFVRLCAIGVDLNELLDGLNTSEIQVKHRSKVEPRKISAEKKIYELVSRASPRKVELYYDILKRLQQEERKRYKE